MMSEPDNDNPIPVVILADVREAIITLVDFGVMDSHDYYDTEPQRKLIRAWLDAQPSP